MNNKKVKKILSCICALTLLLGAIPMNSIKAEAEDGSMTTKDGVEFYAAGTKMDDAEYLVHGLEYDKEEGIFVRLDSETAADIAKTDSLYDEKGNWVNTVYSLARETAGGRIRFNTNSTTIKIEAELYQWDASHVSHAASMDGGKYGFDVYVDTADGSTYVDTAIAETKDEDGNNKIDPGSVFVNKTITLGEVASRDITIYFPITIEVKNVKITVDEGSTVQNHQKGYDGNGRLVFYGSSITQGGCATKPGNTYVNTVGRNLNMEYIDFGMWGRCKGEPEFAEYIAGLGNISAFIYDFDHNMSKASLLEAVHYPYYEIIREAYPDIPIIMMTRPGNGLDKSRAEEPEKGYSTVAEMKEVIRNSFERAKANGDENVHFVDGESFFGYSKGYMKDNAHPNDAGQARMAEVMTAVLEKALAGEKNICVIPQEDCKDEKLNEEFTFAEDEKLSDRWTISSSNLVENKIQLIEVDGNSAMQLAYKRNTGNTPVGYIQYKTGILKSLTDFELEWDATLYKNTNLNKWPYMGSVYRDSSSKGTYEARIQLSNSGYKVSVIDNSDYDTSDKPTYEVTIPDDTLKEKLSSKTELSVHTKVKVETVLVGNGEKMLVFTVSVGDGTAVIDIVPESMNCSPTGLRMHMYGGSNSDETQEEYKIIVDNIKLSKITRSNTLDTAHTLQSVAEVPATLENTGLKAHYKCTECGERYLDAEGFVKANDENLVIAKLCALINEDFEDGTDKWTFESTVYENASFDITKKADGNSIGQLQYTRGKAGTAYVQYFRGVLDGKSDFVLEMDDVSIYHSDVQRWASLGVLFRQRAVGNQASKTLEFRIQGSGTGLSIVPYYDGVKYSDSAEFKPIGYVKIADEACGNAYNSKDGTPLNFDLKLEMSGVGTDEITCIFTVGTETKQLVIPNFVFEPTGLRLNLYGGANTDVDQVYKATFDNVRVYTDSHDLTAVDKVSSTLETAGKRAHYKCNDCGTKFSDSTAIQEVTNAELAYASLSDIKCQVRDNDNGRTDVRFVAYLDDYKQYKNVTYKITITSSGRYGVAECDTVYEKVFAEGIPYTTEDMYGEKGYFASFILKNNTSANLDEEWKVDVTWTDINGNTRSATRTLVVNEERP